MAKREAVMNKYSGSNFDAFLEEEGLLEDVSARAQKRLIALQIEDIIKVTNLSKTKIAENMNTDTIQLDHLLDPENTSITLESLDRLARAVGKKLRIELA
ncbi:MAG: antitoxin HicB [Candidatus Latescibacterota bacterium]|jgi:antitoxin HicB